jgi:uncharacterized protein YacL
VTAIIGLFLGLLLGCCSACPSAPAGADRDGRTARDLDLPGLAMVGLTVAKRHDLITAAENLGIIRRAAATGEAAVPRILVDTSAIIDGRIADIADSGFLFGILRCLASCWTRSSASRTAPIRCAGPGDGAASRSWPGCARAARRRCRSSTRTCRVTPEVDSKLVALAKRNGRAVLTNDLNLNRIADLQGVRVLNVNSLANAVKPALLPGEDLRVRVIQPGKDAGQGVGYLDDGTMVVVEGGARSIDTRSTSP